MEDLSVYLPENQSSLGYSDSQTLFKEEKALMFMSGSWEIPGFKEMERPFEWSVFPIPAPTGRQTVVTFHYDAGIGLNAASLHKQEAREFLQWLTTEEAATALGNELPGFFPMYDSSPISLKDPQANRFLGWNQKYKTDVRWAWPMLRDGRPSGYDLMAAETKAVINDVLTPGEAANDLQKNLALWFEPAQTCLMQK
jgi:raffinose/stachyose/melibiose transport system substrate-binding protein